MQLNRSIKLRANRVREIFTPIVIRAISFRGREPHRGFLQRWCHRDRGRKSYASFNNERANYQRYNASHQSVAAVTTCLSLRSIDLASPKTGACFFSSRVTRVRSFEKRQGEERNDGGTIGSAIPFHRTKWRSVRGTRTTDETGNRICEQAGRSRRDHRGPSSTFGIPGVIGHAAFPLHVTPSDTRASRFLCTQLGSRWRSTETLTTTLATRTFPDSRWAGESETRKKPRGREWKERTAVPDRAFHLDAPLRSKLFAIFPSLPLAPTHSARETGRARGPPMILFYFVHAWNFHGFNEAIVNYFLATT